MQDEAQITINGTPLSASEARVIRLAMDSFADILENQLGLKDESLPLADRYIRDVARVRELIEGKATRVQ
jgi:hypothetical protein